ncbi:AMP-dependent synthetase/ligase [Sphingobacterium spiritivorum]|uniref:AMP-binding enzyme n=1 Tax=Sphingobacterium spiritivorum ATCC 33861 TaxID=525373 RepID=D7VKU2_SPHSI|nr:long-chain fatty acid--CoA ligase [Sphingobacterium spiritivorum]EFK58894.1 AMP-binding enzyme [Sphingobacterium spiritivorum ATCC 33861]QQT34232.1 long-chain fatty acid--CoA ligase [Sphingobacterium spiritivorum]WQD35070.1 long-chain fatty acid--CoA ligase [Sphingobacterium spiritivorum]SUI99314.1 Long-chain-fatty-acid--CoA ligase FadD15 [Sphingobacterium spiritivorum]
MNTLTRVFDFITRYKEEFSKPVMVAGKREGKWKTYSTDEFIEIIDNISKAMLARGVKKGDRIALMSGNRPEWNFVDFAANQIGAAIVPLYPTLSSQDLTYIIADAEVRSIFVSNAELTAKVKTALKENNLEINLFTFEKIDDLPTLDDVIAFGKEQDIDLKPYKDAVSEDDLLTLIYTSGTTGKPKGVLLTHKNVMSNVNASNHLLKTEYNKALSFLPLCHIFERMVVYLYFSRGVQIYYAENLDNIVADINEVKPMAFTTVPRVLEKVYDKIVEKGKALTGIKKALFFWALELGHKYQEPEKNGAFYNFKLGIARKLIFSKWKEALGGEIKLIVSGGAALQERLARVFWAAGIQVLEGYGLTETSPVIAVNTWQPNGVRFGTVGKVLSNLDVKIGQDGEILVKGPSITAGYYKNQEATKEAIDEEGYFHTGDIGELSKDGFLKITDRKKEMFKTAGGKYVAPQVLENKFMESTLIGQVMVLGENRKFPSALIVPAFEELEKWCKHKGIAYTSKDEIIKDPKVIEKYQSEIDRLNAGFGHWEQVKKFKLLNKEWSIDSGELTPKLSLKRKIILQKFEDTINGIYEETGSKS